MNGFSYLCIGTVITLIVLMVVVAYLMVRVRPSLEYYYLIIGMTLGILFLFLIPPYMTPDEDVHIRVSYYVSNYFLGIGPGDIQKDEITMRQCDADLAMYKEETRENYNYYLEKVFQGAGDTSLTTFHYNNRGISRIWVYAVGALGIALARFLGLGAVQTILLGGLFNVVFFVLVTFYCIKKLPFGKIVLFVVALFPMTLQQTSSLSYDNLLLAAFFILTTLSLHWRFGREKIRALEVVFCLLTDVILLGIKGGAYAIFICLPILLQLRRDMFTKRRLLLLGGLLLVCGAVCWLVFGKRVGMYLEQITDPNRTGAYISYFDEYGYSFYELLHPVTNLLSILWRTLWKRGWLYILTMAGQALGWLRIILPDWLIVLYYVVLLGACVRKEGEDSSMNAYHRVVIWGICAFCTVLIYVSMLLYSTPWGAYEIEGIQGRYFLPYLPLVAYTLGSRKIKRRRLTDGMLIVALLGLSAVSCTWILWVV